MEMQTILPERVENRKLE